MFLNDFLQQALTNKETLTEPDTIFGEFAAQQDIFKYCLSENSDILCYSMDRSLLNFTWQTVFSRFGGQQFLGVEYLQV